MHIYAQLNAIPVGNDLINMHCCHHSTKTFWFKFSRDSSFLSSYLIGTGALLCGDRIAWAVRRFGRV